MWLGKNSIIFLYNIGIWIMVKWKKECSTGKNNLKLKWIEGWFFETTYRVRKKSSLKGQTYSNLVKR